MLLTLNGENPGTTHPLAHAEEILLSTSRHQAQLDLIDGAFGPRGITKGWPVQRLLVLRENDTLVSRQLLVLEVLHEHERSFYDQLVYPFHSAKGLTRRTSLLHIFAGGDQRPPAVRWRCAAYRPENEASIIILGHVRPDDRSQHPAGRMLSKAKLLPENHGNGILHESIPCVGFTELWEAAQFRR